MDKNPRKIHMWNKSNQKPADTVPAETNKDKEKIMVKELIIKENNKEIYGKIYYPEKKENILLLF